MFSSGSALSQAIEEKQEILRLFRHIMKVIEKGDSFSMGSSEWVPPYSIVRHPKTPWYLRVLNARSASLRPFPLDMISDLLPILGQLDDFVILRYGYLVLFS